MKSPKGSIFERLDACKKRYSELSADLEEINKLEKVSFNLFVFTAYYYHHYYYNYNINYFLNNAKLAKRYFFLVSNLLLTNYLYIIHLLKINITK